MHCLPFEKNNKRNRYGWQSVTPKSPLIAIEKLNLRQLYSLLVYTHPFRPTSQKRFLELFKIDSFDWKQIYLLPRMVTLESYSRSFQYKILNNILYLNKKLFMFQKLASPLCANFLMRQCSIYFTNAIKSKNYWMTWLYSSKMTLICLI